MRRAPVVFSVCAALASTGCWPGWDFLFDQTPSREHRVEDARVLSVSLEPASLVLSPAFLATGQGGAAPALPTLRIRPAIFDPRGGDIDVDIAVCVAAPTVSFDGFASVGPCEAVAEAGSFHATLTVPVDGDGDPDADPAQRLGQLEIDETFELSHEAIVALFAAAGVPPTQVGGIRPSVVVNISRVFDGRRERERAELPFRIQVDPEGEGATPALFTDSNVLDCREIENDGCFPTDVPAAECGNGVVEVPEQCDPPDDGVTCFEGCFAADVCAVAPQPVCVSLPVVPNTRPVIASLLVADELNFEDGGLDPDDAEQIDVGGVIALRPGQPRFLALPDMFSLAESRQLSFVDASFCPPGSPGASRAALQCGAFPEEMNARWYIADGRAELGSSFDGLAGFGAFFNPTFGEPIGVMFSEGTPVGTREPLVVVLADGDGGMDIATFTLAAE